MPIAISDSLIPNKAGAPVDARSVVSAQTDLANIENAYVGMKVYVTETGKEYRVTAMKEVTVGGFTKQQIDTYETLPDKADLDAKADTSAVETVAGAVETVAGAVASLQTTVAGKADAEDLEALAATVATKVEDFSFTVVDTGGVITASYTPEGGSATALTVSADYQTITIPLSVLGISGLYTYDLYNADGRLMSNTAELDYQITSEALVLKFAGGWTAGTWTLHAQSGKGEQGIRGESGTVDADWTTLTYAASLTLARSESLNENQKLTLTGVVNLTAPTLSSAYPRLLLQITTGGYAVTLGGAELIAASNSTYAVGWYWDGTATRRLAVMEVN